ncbi:uncharacterized protein LACBIDRAFT_324304 [Laccaria bicolor S238N-H82]|uniref:Predicted protein n=1 Tax=Laccaria bicolor (strain S238N-H82 / ATCC MYA-4686) TaxID=486041 RepID=B0D1E0_LACBS|nr:uncharacterized protein LACBIDRAFT_324304 [Laccaria bicolor S238N-H82]EDR11984.1 predicted protein [Laccaria bicolor S238N-H82]|eukprot:XP_001877881.1 predicted protein [Laccaria bicolor S238N-H82]
MPTPEETGPSLEERKLEYVHLANGAQPRSQTSINKSISAFLAKNRARNNASNRSEFLYTLAEQKKRRLLDDQNAGDAAHISSCARTDAKPVDRDLQMKYDIAKNEGPLRRTVKAAVGEESSAAEERKEEKKKNAVVIPDQDLEDPERATAARYPAIDERLENVETHLAIRYVPSPPRTLVARLKFLEDHIIQLEKEYPPWAALHFNQPNRGWPPPPRATPIIVPPHLRPKELPDPPPPTTTVNMGNVAPIQGPAGGGAVPKARGKQSSLQRAVLEKLEIQQAMSDFGKGKADACYEVVQQRLSKFF